MHVILFEIRNILELVTQIIHIHKWNEENDLSRIKKILYIYIFTYSILSSKHRVYYYFCFYFLFSLFSMWTRGKEIACVLKRKKTDLSLWNFRLCTTCGIFCRKFHRCKVSSAVAETNAPSLIKNCNCITAVHPSCLTCASTPGRPKLYIIFVSFVIN